MSIKKITLITLLLVACVSGFAQTRFSIYGGGAFPMGAMKDGRLTDDEPEKFVLLNEDGTKGYAGTGFNVGMDVVIPVSDFGLGIAIGADFFYNGYNSELKDYVSDVKAALDDMEGLDSYKIYKPRFMNVPVLFGLNYKYDFNKNIGIFAEAAVGPNIRFISKSGTKFDYSHEHYAYFGNKEVKYTEYKTTLKYKTAVTFGFKAGLGIMISDCFSIGVDYYGLGSAKVKGVEHVYLDGDEYTDKIYDDKENEFKGKKSISNSEIALRLGYHF